MKNKIYNLLDENFVVQLFNKQILPQYPEFFGIKRIGHSLIKDNIWASTYHVVIEYQTDFIDSENKIHTLPIYCTAHSDEPRLNSFEALVFLWQNGFNKGKLTIPKPLFYSSDFNAFFYQGIEGKNLYQYIRAKDTDAVRSITVKAASWFAKLHHLSALASKAKNFNPLNSAIETIIPGMKNALDKVKTQEPRYFEICRQSYEIINQKEKNFLSSTEKRWLIHGDAHPENVIMIDKNKIGVIDFTDICLADYARDLGAFSQQLEFMMFRKIGDQTEIEKTKQLFLKSYFKNAKITPDSGLMERIGNYYNWTALRTAIFFLLKDKSEPERAHGLLVKISQNLKLNINI